jgi:hypothetical protein
MPATINGTSGFGGNLTGNVTGNADTATSSTTATKLSTTTGDAPTYACRAWVNFDGSKDTTGATSTANTNRLIRDSGNVASVLRNAQGEFTITFSTAMPTASYAAICSIKAVNDTTRHYDFVSVRPLSASSAKVFITQPVSPFGGIDAQIVMLSIFG